ncbi:MAG: hypothetical protein IKS20_15610, partial [Victivallales bacterium]|nr:hypothetical protein [Victivallales bacterium]
YAFVCLLHFLPKKEFSKVGAVALCACAVGILIAWGCWSEHLPKIIGAIVGQFLIWGIVIVYSFYPRVKIHDWLLAAVPLLSGLALSWSIQLANLQVLLRPYAMSVSTKWDIFHLVGATGQLWLPAIACILLLAGGYLLIGRNIAKAGDLPFRGLFGKGVTTLWIAFAVMYLASVAMAFQAMHSCRNAKKELDAYWGLPLNSKTLGELYRKSGRIDQSFWDKLTRLEVAFPKFKQKYDGISGIEGYSNAVLPPEIYEQWKAAFAESPELRRSQELLSEPPPLPEREYGFDWDQAYDKNITKIRSMARLELWSIRFALEANDIHAAQKALQRFDNISSSLLNDYGIIAGMVWKAMEALRAGALAKILESGLADEKWLREQSELLLEKERQMPLLQKRMIMGHAVCMMDAVDKMAASPRGLFLLCPETGMLIGREGAVLARCHCISDFAEFPEKPAGIFAGMLASGVRSFGTRHMPDAQARIRISRAMIAAELARKREGRFPDTIDDLPIDPFSGKPLKYAIGKAEISEEHFQPNEEQSTIDIPPDVKKQFGMTDGHEAEFSRPQKYAFKTEQRTVEAVQIWSVGPDGKDNGGIRSIRSKDDIRYIIPIHDGK